MIRAWGAMRTLGSTVVCLGLVAACAEPDGNYDFGSGYTATASMGDGSAGDSASGDGASGDGDGGSADDGSTGGGADDGPGDDSSDGGPGSGSATDTDTAGDSDTDTAGSASGTGDSTGGASASGTTGGGDTTSSSGTATGGGTPGCGGGWDFSDCQDGPWVSGLIGGSQNTWQCGEPAGVGPPGPNAGMWGTNLSGNYQPQEGSYVQSPLFSLQDCVGSATMTITHWYNFAGGAHCTPFCDGGVVYISNNGGQTWSYLTPTPNDYYTIWPIGSAYNPPDTQDGYRDGSGGWTTSTFNLTPYIGADEVAVRFILGGPKLDIYPTSTGWYIDDVTIE